MPERLPPHSHCLNCEVPIAEDEIFCSDKCKVVHDGKARKEKRRMMYFYLIAIVAIVAISITGSFL